MNLADYLAEYLVKGLAEMAKEAMNKYYLGVASVIPRQKDSLNIGNAIFALKGYDFPKKSEIMQELEAINNARKKIAHEIVKTKGEELLVIDEAVKLLAEHTEALVVLIDEIDPGMPPTNLLDKFQTATNNAPAELPAEPPKAPPAKKQSRKPNKQNR